MGRPRHEREIEMIHLILDLSGLIVLILVIRAI